MIRMLCVCFARTLFLWQVWYYAIIEEHGVRFVWLMQCTLCEQMNPLTQLSPGVGFQLVSWWFGSLRLLNSETEEAPAVSDTNHTRRHSGGRGSTWLMHP